MSRKRRALFLSLFCFLAFFLLYGKRAYDSLESEQGWIADSLYASKLQLDHAPKLLELAKNNEERYFYALRRQKIKQQLYDAWKIVDLRKIPQLLAKEEELFQEQKEKNLVKRFPHDELKAKKDYAINSFLSAHGMEMRIEPKIDGVAALIRFTEKEFFILLPLLCLLLGADLYSKEKGSGSLKLMLTRKKSRIALFLELFFQITALSLLVFFFASLGVYLGSGLLAGWGDMGYPLLLESGELITSKNFLLQALLFTLAGIFFYCSLAAFFSLFFKKAWLSLPSISLAVLLMFYLGQESLRRNLGGFWLYSPLSLLNPYTTIQGQWVFPVYEKVIEQNTGKVLSLPAPHQFHILSIPLTSLQALLLITGIGFIFFVLSLSCFQRKDLL